MFRIEGSTIHLTRGDIATIEVSTIVEDTGEDYVFQTGDIVRLTVVEKNNYGNVVLTKEFKLQEGGTTVVDIILSTDDTRIGGVISKPKKYYYEVELNPDTAPRTIVGHDDDGPKEFILYPEGSDQNES